MKTNHYPHKITFHLVTNVPMTSFTLKSSSKLGYFLHFRYSIVIPRFIPHANMTTVFITLFTTTTLLIETTYSV